MAKRALSKSSGPLWQLAQRWPQTAPTFAFAQSRLILSCFASSGLSRQAHLGAFLGISAGPKQSADGSKTSPQCPLLQNFRRHRISAVFALSCLVLACFALESSEVALLRVQLRSRRGVQVLLDGAKTAPRRPRDGHPNYKFFSYLG